jgi:hypothetical protein
MTDNALKTPLNMSMVSNADRRANNFQQSTTKSMPVKVTKVDKDFVTVSFEPQNGIWTLPQIKIPQSMSRYGRDPTQVGDLGYAVPADYNTDTLTGLGGTYTNFFPKGNLTPLSFQPFSRTQNETRDYDQLTHTGGPNGVKIIQSPQQKTENKPPNSGGTPPGGGTPQLYQRRLRGMGSRSRASWLARGPRVPRDDSSSQQKPMAYMEINKDGLITHTSADTKHQVLVDQANKKVALNVPASGHTVFLGGPGKDSSLYAPVATTKGPAVNVMAKYKNQDE